MTNIIKDIKQGDIFSEISRYIFSSKDNKSYKFKHLESGNIINLDEKYVTDLLTTGNQFFSEVKVTKEDKKDGTKGIRSIWEEIYDGQVFTVCFKKQDTALSTKKYTELREKQINDAVAIIEATAKSKKGVAEEAKKVLLEVQNNPIFSFEKGESRILKGYKVQFTSRDGKYDCIDMDLVENRNELSKAIRPVNIVTIEWLVYKGVKYTVE